MVKLVIWFDRRRRMGLDPKEVKTYLGCSKVLAVFCQGRVELFLVGLNIDGSVSLRKSGRVILNK